MRFRNEVQRIHVDHAYNSFAQRIPMPDRRLTMHADESTRPRPDKKTRDGPGPPRSGFPTATHQGPDQDHKGLDFLPLPTQGPDQRDTLGFRVLPPPTTDHIDILVSPHLPKGGPA